MTVSIFLFVQLLLLFSFDFNVANILLVHVDPAIRDTVSLNSGNILSWFVGTAKENEQAVYKTLLKTKELHTYIRTEQSTVSALWLRWIF